MGTNGYIKISRKIDKWGWWSDDAVFRFFIGIILKANYQDGEFKGEKVERGSFITSIPSLCTYLEMSERKVRRCLECLRQTGEIIDEANNRFRKITIVNYDDYQDVLPCQKQQGKQQGKRQGKQQGKRQGKQQGKRHPIEEIKNKSLTDSYSEKKTKEKNAATPRALGERTSAAVSYEDVRRFQIENHIGSGELVDEFFDAFQKSGTRIPEGWQEIYSGYAKSDLDPQLVFIEKLSNGDYRELWGAADAGT